MLVLTRKPGQSINLSSTTCGDCNIRFVIKRIGGGQVRVGIEAPEHVKIIRDDINVEENHTVHDIFSKPATSDDVCKTRAHITDGG